MAGAGLRIKKKWWWGNRIRMEKKTERSELCIWQVWRRKPIPYTEFEFGFEFDNIREQWASQLLRKKIARWFYSIWNNNIDREKNFEWFIILSVAGKYKWLVCVRLNHVYFVRAHTHTYLVIHTKRILSLIFSWATVKIQEHDTSNLNFSEPLPSFAITTDIQKHFSWDVFKWNRFFFASEVFLA